MVKNKFPFHEGILFKLLLPVIIVGILMSTLTVSILSRPMNTFLEKQFDANLQLASSIGLQACENSFNYLLELRLEQNPEMNQTLKQEALEKIKSISTHFPSINLLVIEAGSDIRACSIGDLSGSFQTIIPDHQDDALFNFSLNGEPVRGYVHFFPFWDWHVISFVFEKDYKRPVRMAYWITHLSAAGVFAAVLITLLSVFYLFIRRPLNRLVAATEGVSEGRFRKIDQVDRHEIGRLMTSFNTMVDSLEHEKAEVKSLINQLTESEALFRSQFEYGNIGIAINTVEKTWIRANSRLCSMLGYSEEELKTKVWTELSHPDDLEKEMWTYNRMIDGKIDTYETERRLFHKNGDVIYTQLNVSCHRQDDGNVRFIIASVLNITDRKRAEEEKNKLDAQLLQSQKMEAVGTLAGGIAHDFNNLLSGIFGFAQLAKNHLAEPERAQKDIEQIIEGARKSSELVQQILTFSRKSQAAKQPLAVYLVVKEALKLIRASIPKTIQIKQTINSRSMVLADPSKINQVVINLCTNAYQSMVSTGGILGVGLKEVDFSQKDCITNIDIRPGRYLKLEISDTGEGMESEVMDRIFEPYFTTKELDKGTGLGLAVVQGIVKEHLGSISVYSEPGQGSSFHVYLPVTDKKASEENKAEESYPVGGVESILFVDDEDFLRNSAKELLVALGYTVDAFPEGKSAFKAYQEAPDRYDIVVTDMTMPGITGMELSNQVLALNPHQPIILCTGHSELINREKALAMGIRDYYEKPVIVNELVRRIRRIFDGT